MPPNSIAGEITEDTTRNLLVGTDDDGSGSYAGYVETTVDTGIWMFVFTLVSCLLCTLSLPVMIILGKRYEKRRIREEEQALSFGAKEGVENNNHVTDTAVPIQQQSNGSQKRSKKSKRRTKNNGFEGTQPAQFDETSVNKPDIEVDLEASRKVTKEPEVSFSLPSKAAAAAAAGKRRKHGRHRSHDDPSVMTRSTRGSRRSGVSENNSVLTGMTNGSSYIHGRTKSEVSGAASSSNWKLVVDKIVMPPYQDDEARSVLTREERTVVSGMSRRSAATLASNTSSSYLTSSTVLDTRPTRRRTRLAHSTAETRSRRTKKQSKREDIVSPGYDMSQSRAWSDVKSDLGGRPNGGKISSNNTVGSEILTTNSQMSGKYSYSSNRSRGSRFSRGYRNYSRRRSGSPVSIAPSMMSKIEDDISPNDAADANDPGQNAPFQDEDDELHICCGKNALWRPAIISRILDNLIDIAQPDAETRRILKLAIPFTIAVIMETIFDNVEVALVGNFISTNALTAYAMTDLLIGTTWEFISGLYDACMTVCPHAIGAGNNYLCGQYVQITIWLFIFAQTPTLIFWWYYLSDVIVLLNLPREVGDIAQAYARVAIWGDLIEELADIFHGLLEITDHEAFSATISIVEGLISVTTICYVLFFYNLTLIEIAYINLILSTIFFIMAIVIALRFGWVSEYIPGMFNNFALKNTLAVKNLLNTAIPLSIGSLLAYGEWEVLTVFASHLGQAEVTAWAVLGYIWETFEAASEGIGDGAEVRVAYHLGKGNPQMAKISANKSILLGTIFSCFVTSIFFIIGDSLPVWFTTDPVLQSLIRDLLPLIGVGNITMSFGMVCWAIIGAQGRYRLATLAGFVSSWSIIMPMAAIMTYVFRFDLRAITAAVVIGYAVTSTFLTYIVQRSDWERLSKIIIELNQATGETYSDRKSVV